MAASPERPDELVDPRVERTSGETLQRAVIADVLPGGEARVESARVRKHADASGGRRSGRGRRRAPSMLARPLSGIMSVASIRRSVVLPAPFGPSSPVISTVGRGERHAVDGAHFAAAAERLGQILDDDQVRAPRRSGQSGGRRLFSKCSTQDAGSVANVGSSMKAAMSRGAHACGDTMWP